MIEGLIQGEFFYLIGLIIALLLLYQFRMNTKPIIIASILGWIGHFIGAFLSWKFVTIKGGDAINYFYFYYRMGEFLTGTTAVCILTDYFRQYLVGDSLLGCFYLYSVFGYLGTILYLIVYKQVTLDLTKNNHLINQSNEFLPYLAFVCWPPLLFWTSLLGKDSLSCFFIGLFLLSFVMIKQNKYYLIPLILSACCQFILRPYLLIVGGGAILGCIVINSRLRLLTRLLLLLVTIIIFYYLFGSVVLKTGNIESFDYEVITNRALLQETMLNTGTSLPLLTNNPHLVLLFLPYQILGNLFFPLFYLAHNFTAIISSCFNLILLYGFIYTLRNYRYLMMLVKSNLTICFFMMYFLFGISFLGFINTNLGLAERHKLMYLPTMLIVIFAVRLYKRKKPTLL